MHASAPVRLRSIMKSELVRSRKSIDFPPWPMIKGQSMMPVQLNTGPVSLRDGRRKNAGIAEQKVRGLLFEPSRLAGRQGDSSVCERCLLAVEVVVAIPAARFELRPDEQSTRISLVH